MISASMAIKMGATKLKDHLKKNGFTFRISIEKINDWLAEQGHSDLEVRFNIQSNEIEIDLNENE